MKKHIIAFVERVGSTFLFAFLGIVLAAGSGIDLLSFKAAAIAGGLSVAKYLYTLAAAYLAKPDPLTVELPAGKPSPE